jgi:hypothetical protein
MLKTMEQFAKRLQYSKSLISLLRKWYLFYVTNIIADFETNTLVITE